MSKKRLNHSILAILCMAAVLITMFFGSYTAHAEELSDDFNVYAYANRYVDLQRAYGGNLEAYEQHYKTYGINEKRNGKPYSGDDIRNEKLTFIYVNRVYNGVDYSAVFDPFYYLDNNKDVKRVFGEDQEKAFRHFIEYGMKEGRAGVDGFNVYAYANRYGDLQKALGGDLSLYYIHYAKYGKIEKRNCASFSGNDIRNKKLCFTYISLVKNGIDYSAGFDPIKYADTYGDIKKAFGDDQQAAFDHFLAYGMSEGRSGNGSFNVYAYANRYGDLFNAFKTNLPLYYNHYSVYGKSEGRNASGSDTKFNVSNYIDATNLGNGKYKISIINPTVSGTITGMLFPTWSDEKGQDDIVWYQGTKASDGTWYAEIDGGNHSSAGGFTTHIYASVGGKQVYLGAANYVNTFETEKYYGWVKRDNNYYFYDRTTGVMQKGGTACGITLNADGSAVLDQYAIEKLPIMLSARQIVESITSPGDSLAVKQEKCYQWVAKWPYLLKGYPFGNFANSYACPDAHYANNIFNSYGDQDAQGAECVGEAAALAYLYAELNFGDVYLYSSNLHGWVYAGGRYWDPLFVESRGRQYYNAASYESAPTYIYKIN